MATNKEGRQVRRLKSNERNLNVASLYQLYEISSRGEDDNRDINAEQNLLRKCYEVISERNFTFKIKKLKFLGFRKFKEFYLNLDRELIVIIGDNGAGKTSIVDGIVKMLSWISANIEKEGKNASPISISDINIFGFDYARVDATFELNEDSSYKATLSKSQKGAAKSRDSYVTELRALGNLYRVVNSKWEINLPLFAYYSADRLSNSSGSSNVKSLEKKLTELNTSSRHDAYVGALSGSSRFSDLVEWFSILENRKLKNDRVNIPKLIARYSELKNILDQRMGEGKIDYGDNDWNEYNALSQRIIEATPLKIDPVVQKKLDCLKTAITTLAPEIHDIFIDSRSGIAELKIEFKSEQGNPINISQLSKGQQSIIALAADIARRLMMLNPNMENPLEGIGIVVIDEIELHLHPKWQQEIVLNLRKAFPKIQFILTTHSPQILSTVDVSSIRKLKIDGDGEVFLDETKFQTKGVMSSDILEQIMETESIPNIEEARLVSIYLQNVSQGKYQEQESLEIFKRLKSHFGEFHPLIEKCEREVAFQELKKTFIKKTRDDKEAT